MKNVFFSPWVGKKYIAEGFSGANGIKLLILGESHYCSSRNQCDVCGIISEKKCPNKTNEVFSEYFDYKQGTGDHSGWMNTFTRFTSILFGYQVDNETLFNFWESVVFYNYVQSSTTSTRTPPTNQQFDQSKDAFFEVLEVYMPDLIIVWGERLWKHLPDIGRWGEEVIVDQHNGLFYYYKLGNKDIPAYSVYHPSTSKFNCEDTKYLKEAIRLVSKSEQGLV